MAGHDPGLICPFRHKVEFRSEATGPSSLSCIISGLDLNSSVTVAGDRNDLEFHTVVWGDTKRNLNYPVRHLFHHHDPRPPWPIDSSQVILGPEYQSRHGQSCLRLIPFNPCATRSAVSRNHLCHCPREPSLTTIGVNQQDW